MICKMRNEICCIYARKERDVREWSQVIKIYVYIFDCHYFAHFVCLLYTGARYMKKPIQTAVFTKVL